MTQHKTVVFFFFFHFYHKKFYSPSAGCSLSRRLDIDVHYRFPWNLGENKLQVL